MSGLDSEPRVSVVILNYNRPQYTLECIRSVLKSNYSNFEVIVVDNCSDFSLFTFLKEKIDVLPVKLIRVANNTGYAGGNNVGILHSTGKYILILNDDVTVDTDMMSGLVTLAEKHEAIGIIGPATYCYNSSELYTYSPEILKVNNELVDVSVVVGAALMIRREVIEKIGLLDEDYFMYHEDADWCVRARNAGYRIVCAPKVRAWHNVNEKTWLAPYFAYFYHRNYFLFAAKHCKTSREALHLLFRNIIWYDKRNFPALYPLFALTRARSKTKSFKAYFAGIIAGIAFFLRHCLFA